MNFFLFLSLFVLIGAFMLFYSYTRFFRPLHLLSNRASRYVHLLIFLDTLLFAVQALWHIFTPSVILYTVLSSGVGLSFILFIFALLYDATHTSMKHMRFSDERRDFLKRSLDVTALITLFSYLGSALFQGLKFPNTNHVAIEIAHLKGLRIAQLSDVHIGSAVTKAFVQECVKTINALNVDIVVITGDLVDQEIEHAHHALQPLKMLQSRLGTYYVLGNHEYFHHANKILKALPALNITALLNRGITLEHNAQPFNLVGLNDLSSLRMNYLLIEPAKAFFGIDTTLPTLVLAHQPKTTTLLTDYAYDLMLSGHTHGGQIFPFGFLVMLEQKFLAGYYRLTHRKQLFVSRGTGYWGPPLRFLAPSEITLITT